MIKLNIITILVLIPYIGLVIMFLNELGVLQGVMF